MSGYRDPARQRMGHRAQKDRGGWIYLSRPRLKQPGRTMKETSSSQSIDCSIPEIPTRCMQLHRHLSQAEMSAGRETDGTCRCHQPVQERLPTPDSHLISPADLLTVEHRPTLNHLVDLECSNSTLITVGSPSMFAKRSLAAVPAPSGNDTFARSPKPICDGTRRVPQVRSTEEITL